MRFSILRAFELDRRHIMKMDMSKIKESDI